MPIELKRAYDSPAPEDGYRVLVDRLWPRGIAKNDLAVDEWLKDAAPSDRLRKAVHGGEMSWEEFRESYRAELDGRPDVLRGLAEKARQGTLTLVFGARDRERNNAVVLREYLRDADTG